MPDNNIDAENSIAPDEPNSNDETRDLVVAIWREG